MPSEIGHIDGSTHSELLSLISVTWSLSIALMQEDLIIASSAAVAVKSIPCLQAETSAATEFPRGRV